MESNAQQPTASTLPLWPGGFGIYKISRNAVRLNLALLIELVVLTFAVSFLLSTPKTGYLGQVLADIIALVLSVMTTRVLICSVRGQKVTLNEVFQDNLPLLSLKMVGLGFVIGAITLGSFLLLVVPAFFVVPRLALATYFLIDKNMGIFDAIGASWKATKGNVGKVWGVFGVNFCYALLFFTIIGIPFAIYFLFMYSAATAVLYEFLTHRQLAVPAA